jgi:hypothetical protein
VRKAVLACTRMWKQLSLGAVILFTVACASTGPLPDQSPLISPLVSVVATPVSNLAVILDGPNFEIAPVMAGDTRVSGRGPVNVPIVIVDVTLSAKPLGNGTISNSGNFTIDLSGPAPEGHSIGIQVVDVAGSSYAPSQEFAAALDAKAGPGFKDYPTLGPVYTQVTVEP